MWANHPEIAQRWADEAKTKKTKKTKKRPSTDWKKEREKMRD